MIRRRHGTIVSIIINDMIDEVSRGPKTTLVPKTTLASSVVSFLLVLDVVSYSVVSSVFPTF